MLNLIAKQTFFRAEFLVMAKYQIVLGSGSKYRAEQLADLGFEFKQIVPDVDEEAFKQEFSDPVILAILLSNVKAENVRAQLEKEPWFEKDVTYFLIASDQLVEFDGQILGKPGTKEKAIEQLMLLSGNEHNLITAVTMFKVGAGGFERKSDAVIERMKMHKLSIMEIQNYVNAVNPVDCAGSYQIEGIGLGLFSSIIGEDFTSIKGLPLMKVLLYLRDFDYPLF